MLQMQILKKNISNAKKMFVNEFHTQFFSKRIQSNILAQHNRILTLAKTRCLLANTKLVVRFLPPRPDCLQI